MRATLLQLLARLQARQAAVVVLPAQPQHRRYPRIKYDEPFE
jgi:hypothetical protein